MKFVQGLWVKMFIAALLLTGVSACVSVPRESADLSIELGNRIAAIETAHLALLDKYFAEKRDRVDDFLVREWVPEFSRQFFANPQIAKLWDQVVSSGSAEDRLQFLVTLGPKLQGKINQKRLELIAPLDEAERLVRQQLRDSYDQARAINNSVTSFLVSASKVAENRNRYLEMLGVKDEKLAGILEKVDAAVADLTEKAEKASGQEEKIRDYYRKLKELKEKL